MIVSQKRDVVMISGEVYNPNAGPQHRQLFAVSWIGPGSWAARGSPRIEELFARNETGSLKDLQLYPCLHV
jgi:hypothetical protein